MLDSRISQNFNRPIANPQFRASQNVSKPIEAEEKQGMSPTAKWAIGIGLTALASYGIYYALTKGRVKSPKPTPKPENPVPEIKEMAIDAFKRDGRFEKGKAILKAKNGAYTIDYTGNITSTGKDGSKVVMEYVDGVLQKSTKTAKDGTKIFDKTYSYNKFNGEKPIISKITNLIDNKEILSRNFDSYHNTIETNIGEKVIIENADDRTFKYVYNGKFKSPKDNKELYGLIEYYPHSNKIKTAVAFPMSSWAYFYDENGKVLQAGYSYSARVNKTYNFLVNSLGKRFEEGFENGNRFFIYDHTKLEIAKSRIGITNGYNTLDIIDYRKGDAYIYRCGKKVGKYNLHTKKIELLAEYNKSKEEILKIIENMNEDVKLMLKNRKLVRQYGQVGKDYFNVAEHIRTRYVGL